MLKEKELIERVKKGEDDAMEVIVKTYKRKLYKLAYDLTNNSADAEDLVQEAFFKAFSQINRFRGESMLGTWLYRITFNHYLDLQRKKSNLIYKQSEEITESSDEMQPKDGHNPARKYEDKQISKHIESALKKISPREKHVFMLRYYNDCQLREISEIMNISEGTVKSLLFRALKKLRKELAFYASGPYVKEWL
jgi:RNA polymerase sigma-70 factor (ECF subfamily)